MAAPKGNSNAKRAKIWSDAIRKALAGDKGSINRIAQALIRKAEDGDLQAIKEIGDRLEGKPMQPVGGDQENPVSVRFIIES